MIAALLFRAKHEAEPLHREAPGRRGCRMHLHGSPIGTLRATELDYVYEWDNKSAAMKDAVQKACPGPFPGFFAPAFVMVDFLKNSWSAAFQPWLRSSQLDQAAFSFHK